jgi:hypothetical protein
VEAKRNRLALLLLVLLTLGAAGLRLAGTGRMLPHLAEPDAHVVDQERMIRAGSPPEARATGAWVKYPHLLGGILSLLPSVEPPAGPVTDAETEERIREVSRPWRRARTLCALVSLLAVPATWFVARRFIGSGWALLAAAFVATSLLHHNFSWQARPHGPLSGVATLGLASLLALRRRPTVWMYAAAGVLVALSLATLQNGVLLLPAALGAHFAVGAARRRDALVLVALVPLALAVWLAYPFLWEPIPQTRTGGHRVDPSWLDGGGFLVTLRDLWWHDPALLILAPLGAVWALMRSRRELDPAVRADASIVILHSLPYFLVLCLYARTFERFQLPIVPTYALLAATAVRAAAGALRSRGAPAWTAPALAVVALAFPVLCSARLTLLCGAPDTAEVAARWIAERPRLQGQRILVRPNTSLPVLQDPALFQLEVDNDVALLRPWQLHLRRNGVAADSTPWELAAIPWRDMQATGHLPAFQPGDPRVDQLFDEMLLDLDARWALVELQTGKYPGVVPVHLGRRSVVRKRFSPFGIDSAEDAAPRELLWRGYQGENLVLRALRARHWGPRYDLLELMR